MKKLSTFFSSSSNFGICLQRSVRNLSHCPRTLAQEGGPWNWGEVFLWSSVASHRCTCLMEEGLCRRPCPHQHRLHPQQAHWVCRVRGKQKATLWGHPAPMTGASCQWDFGWASTTACSLYSAGQIMQLKSSLSIFPPLKTILMKSFKRMCIREKTTVTCLHMYSGNIHTCDFRLPGLNNLKP